MLDTIEKLSKIAFAGVATTVIGIAGLNIEWQKLGLKEDSWCFEHADRVQTALLKKAEAIPDLLITRYADRCDVSVEQAARVLNEDKVIAELAQSYSQGDSYKNTGGYGTSGDQKHEDPSFEFDGFVALGRITPNNNSQINFDIAGNGGPSIGNSSPPGKGSLLLAKWSVNLRENTSLTSAGENPILSVIMEGECVIVKDAPQPLRGQYWAAISRSECS